jgi:hypothetical protein
MPGRVSKVIVTPGCITSVIGLDPGPTTGMAFLDYRGLVLPGRTAPQWDLVGRTSLQVDGESAQIVLEAMISKYYSDPNVVGARYAGVENFITGNSAGTKGKNADVTRQLVMQLTEHLQIWGYSVQIRKAADVKPWATDRRLQSIGMLGPAEQKHANDGVRHALFAAKADAKMRDPLA